MIIMYYVTHNCVILKDKRKPQWLPFMLYKPRFFVIQ